MEKLKEIMAFTPLWVKVTLIALVILLLTSVVFSINTYRGKSDALKELEKESLILKVELKEQKEITDSYKSVADSLTKDWEDFDLDKLETDIKKRYDEKRDDALSQPIDITISVLSDWLNEY